MSVLLFVVVMTVLVLMCVLIILVMMMMFMVMSVFIVMMVLMSMLLVFGRMRVSVCHVTSVRVLVTVLMREVDIEFDSFDGRFLSAGNVQMVPIKLQLLQFVLQVVRINAQIEQRANEHVAADPAENIQIQGLHLCDGARLVLVGRCRFCGSKLHLFTATRCASSLIWLAA